MNKSNAHQLINSFILASGLLASSVSLAWQAHHHNANRYDEYPHHHGYNNYNRGLPYGSGGFYFGGGDWGSGPNIVINVPAPRYYAPACQSIEVCNSYGDCWLEPICD